ncbi:lytic polysaccharide monooxygenase auxiliary activity family 9 protein [Allokutzneria albata]|uniref:Chitin-binding protein n=1 Tax=Allokutzneria albata TaxID=211114 RepID=A0A1H0A349_ALLAB|nr:lytic polysaccharide monooxygenase [Allokutzneria albata]SDN27817.1 chitin-binding protein [Allokutzneria albata]
MLSKRFKRAVGVALFGLIPVSLSLVTAGTANAHGYTQSPASRSYNCKLGVVQNCGPIQWEPQSVEGPKGFPSAGPANGSLCSAGNAGFKQLDDPRGGSWPAPTLASGSNYQFTWTFTAPHRTTKFHYYITKNGYNPSQPLTRDQLELTPFATVDYGGKQPPTTYSHTAKLPSGKTGKHLIYAVWDVHDTANAFYSCADVNFG